GRRGTPGGSARAGAGRARRRSGPATARPPGTCRPGASCGHPASPGTTRSRAGRAAIPTARRRGPGRAPTARRGAGSRRSARPREHLTGRPLVAVAEFAAQELAGDRLGQLVEELDLAGVLVGGHLLAAEGDELLGRGALAGAQADVGLDGLAAVSVGHADHGGLADRLVLVE